MRVAKRFTWEGAHRLPWHDGLCKNNHGHSYVMEAAVDGAVDTRGMVLDFAVIKRALKPLVDAWDHATLVAHDDHAYLAFVREQGFKHYVFPFDTTAENLARYAADVIVYGHTHRQLVTRADGRLVVNPGAAGARRFNLEPSVAILTIDGGAAEVQIVEL